ncbi:PD-(D/E)XK nuclease family protein [Sphingomonas sp. PP-CE-1G-424]|uniref:PD-(D/E)XK nuclease family protein n=1 Tax=Sphingomonas sp. PP-CE-1G-424 TaxID=2135658 RepID=UPI001055D8B2|nr:PD-(D/E)XK nuclease family protein [Sphingomonas sp. PP-CE-1G-424]TCP64611.1 PD-(D/E)XK nuclease superfamily protein [Sphingomonas sp. PP-CE-1G-424]
MENLTSPAHVAASASYPSASRLEAAFLAFRHVLPDAPARAPQQFYALGDLETAFRALKPPLAAAKEQGGLINPWALASLKRDEIRTAAALAGLWMSDFGGLASQRFAAAYLTVALPDVDWSDELGAGYQVSTEVCPLGEGADRVDLVITTASHLIGIEVKIRADLGPMQLERYTASLGRRAELQKLVPAVIFLAPFRTTVPTVASTTWSDVARAARQAVGTGAIGRTFVEHMIASFGDHVMNL